MADAVPATAATPQPPELPAEIAALQLDFKSAIAPESERIDNGGTPWACTRYGVLSPTSPDSFSLIFQGSTPSTLTQTGADSSYRMFLSNSDSWTSTLKGQTAAIRTIPARDSTKPPHLIIEYSAAPGTQIPDASKYAWPAVAKSENKVLSYATCEVGTPPAKK